MAGKHIWYEEIASPQSPYNARFHVKFVDLTLYKLRLHYITLKLFRVA